MTYEVSANRLRRPGALLLAIMAGGISLSGCEHFRPDAGSAEKQRILAKALDNVALTQALEIQSAQSERNENERIRAHQAHQAAINEGIQQSIISQTAAPPLSDM